MDNRVPIFTFLFLFLLGCTITQQSQNTIGVEGEGREGEVIAKDSTVIEVTDEKGNAIASSRGQNAPVVGDTIHIRNCTGEPKILEITQGTEVTLNSLDEQEHVILLDNKEQTLPAKGSFKVTVNIPSGFGPPFTTTYLCDTNPAGAILIKK